MTRSDCHLAGLHTARHGRRSAILAVLPHRWPPAPRPVLAKNIDSLSSRTGCSGRDDANLHLHQDIMGSALQGTIWPAGLGASAGTDGISHCSLPWTNSLYPPMQGHLSLLARICPSGSSSAEGHPFSLCTLWR